jgi:hypothetical protein
MLLYIEYGPIKIDLSGTNNTSQKMEIPLYTWVLNVQKIAIGFPDKMIFD